MFFMCFESSDALALKRAYLRCDTATFPCFPYGGLPFCTRIVPWELVVAGCVLKVFTAVLSVYQAGTCLVVLGVASAVKYGVEGRSVLPSVALETAHS